MDIAVGAARCAAMLAAHLGLRYLRKRRAAWLALAAIALTVAASVVVMGVSQGFVEVMQRQVRAMESDVTAEPMPGHYGVVDSPARRAALAQVPGVAGVAPFVGGYALMTPRVSTEADARYTIPCAIDAVDLGLDAELGRVGPRLLHASPTVDLNSPPLRPDQRGSGVLTPSWRDHTALIGLAVLPGVGFLPPPPRAAPIPGVIVGREIPYSQGIDLGMRVELLVPNGSGGATGKIQAEVSDTLTSGVYEIDRMTVFLPLASGQRLTDLVARGERPAQVSGYRLRVAADADPVVVAKRVGDETGLWTRTWRERRGNLVASAEQQRNVLLVVMVIIQCITVFIVYAVFSTLVAEKRHDLGVLLGLGARPRQIVGAFLVASLAACLAGSALGWAIGWTVLPLLDPITHWLGVPIFPEDVFYSPETPISFDARWPLFFIALMSVVGLLAALLPAWRASRIDPAVILREAD